MIRLDDKTHRAFLGDRELIRATTALAEVGIIDTTWFTDERISMALERGTIIHEGIHDWHMGYVGNASLSRSDVEPYWDGFVKFLGDTGFVSQHAEEPIWDEAAGYAGRYDLLGVLPRMPPGFDDLIDVKTGSVPGYVGFQTMAYRRRIQSVKCRRWALELSGTGTYRLIPLNLTADHQRIDWPRERQHEAIFLAAVAVARYKKGL
jgi:hypothetical protein